MIILTREEAQQILDALQCATPPTFSTKLVEDWQSAVETLRARLAQPDGNCNGMPAYEGSLSAGQRLAQPEPEPVADKYLMEVECTKCGAKQDGVLTVTAPPQREWQGLTDMEIEQIVDQHWEDLLMFAEAIEVKLKEKNS